MLPNIGLGELTVIVLVALLVFGPNKLPEMMRSVGKAIGKFQRESQSALSEFRNATNLTGDLGLGPVLGAFDAPDAKPASVAPVSPEPAAPVQTKAVKPSQASRKPPAKKPTTKSRAPAGPNPPAGSKRPAGSKTAAGSKRPAGKRPPITEPFEDT